MKAQFATESDFAKAFWETFQYRAHKHTIAYHLNNEGKRAFALTAYLKARGLVTGISDYPIVLPDGRAAFLELKNGKNKTTPAQDIFLARLEAHPAKPPYAVAYSIEECMDFLNKHGGLK